MGSSFGASAELRAESFDTRAATGIDWDRYDPRITPLLADFTAQDHIPTFIEEVALSAVFRTLDVVELP